MRGSTRGHIGCRALPMLGVRAAMGERVGAHLLGCGLCARACACKEAPCQAGHPCGCACRGVRASMCACVLAGVRACACTWALVLYAMGAGVSACAEVLGCAQGGVCLLVCARAGVDSPMRVCTACPRQPELIIVVVTVSPLIPQIPLPPARRGLQINKSSLGAGASKHTYVPAGQQHRDFRPPVGAAREWA